MQITKIWVIRTYYNNFIGIDSGSGGYPFVTNFWFCKKFSTLEEAQNFINYDWGSTMDMYDSQIYSCDEVGLQFVKNIKTDPYEVELAALKLKYGKE